MYINNKQYNMYLNYAIVDFSARGADILAGLKNYFTCDFNSLLLTL